MLKIYELIGSAFAFIILIVGVFFRGKKKGENDLLAKQSQKILDEAIDVKKTRENINNLGDNELDDRMRPFISKE